MTHDECKYLHTSTPMHKVWKTLREDEEHNANVTIQNSINILWPQENARAYISWVQGANKPQKQPMNQI